MTTIEQYSPRHNKHLVDLILDIQQNEFQIPVTREDQPDILDVEPYYMRGNGNFWVAVHEGTVVGSIALLDIGNGAGALRKMFVHRDHRGQAGTGQRLLETLLHWAREKEFGVIYLGTTEKFKAAHRFYERNGFTEVPVGTLPSKFPVMKVDVKFYKYLLA